MTKKQAIKKELEAIQAAPQDTKEDKLAAEQRTETLKRLAKNLLTVSQFEEVFGDSLIEL